MSGSPEGPDDHALLRAHVAGDPDAFGLLLARHRDRLWAVALRTTGNPEDASDGLQDGLVAAYRRAGTFRGDSAVTTWLHRVVVNACLDRLRARKVRAADPLPDDLDEQASRGAVVGAPVPATDPERAATDAETRERVLAALATLPPEQRAALVLVDMEGYGVAEAAAVLDCAVGTVKSRCSRGRARLAALLADLVAVPAAEQPPAPPRNRPAPSGVPSPRTTRGPPADAP
ncbi:RNA polymerase sigma factor SigM [Nocardioides sp. ChNu-153]|uniref:RNA polymerase sigma factor SigM n=1 Tax=unclassified Nocardioides TaxID=2615069 RepID=UPI002406F222|nr:MULTISPECIES: RNA polymerase sigma factor SigM [unclassified Nocardioides]MDF9718138.1 RNA polymerase sigma factor SigM [Nocardioides sp. ChNu-99]MDN7121173.1 RNA polymerase sigma factor SigM [Nocardioides sp. ChNu-153]